jgi:hypothetical protein
LLEQVNVLDLVPVRRASWVEKDGRVVIERPKPERRSLAALFEWLGFYMSMRKIRLDEPGSEAWRLLDGRRTVHDVVRDLRERFGDEVEPAEERVGRLVQLFHQEDFISYPDWDPPGLDAPV